MTTDRPRIDPQDRQFGASASRDQDIEDELESEGAKADDLPESPASSPRAAGKAEPS